MSEINIGNEQNVILNNRKSIIVTGIKSVDSFDETMIVATTVNDTVINVEGLEMTIKDVNLDRCQFEAVGEIVAIYYESAKSPDKSGFIRRLFGRK